MPTSLAQGTQDVVTFKILSDGQAIPQTYGVVSIKVSKEINKISTAKIKIIDGGVGTGDKFEASESSNFLPGKEITIKAGYNSQEEVIFKGIVIKHGLQISPVGNSTLIVECKNKAIKTTTIRKTKFFKKKKDSEIISAILAESGMNKSVEATTIVLPEIIQANVTDWDFVLMRADTAGMIVIADDDKIDIKKPQLSGSPSVDINYGSTLLDINIEVDARSQYTAIKGYSWDMKSQELKTATGQKASASFAGSWKVTELAKVTNEADVILQTPSTLPPAYLDDWASAKHTKAALALLKGTVRCRGIATIKLGGLIKLSGLSKRFNGNVFVGGLEHLIEEGNWTTTIKIGLEEKWYDELQSDIDAPNAAGILPPISGLRVGKVMKIHEDPDANYRVQVKLPNQPQDDVIVTARLITFYATAEAGVFFMPEINDEVIVGFINEDAQSAVILGSVYNSKSQKSPYAPNDKNNEKAIVTKSKLKIHFEDEKKIITISTPAENSITLDDDKGQIVIVDKNKNTITMNSSGIEMKSDKDIILKAKNIKIEAQAEVSIKGTSGVKTQGANIENKADAKFSAEAAMAELKGSGTTTIKGGMVMIN